MIPKLLVDKLLAQGIPENLVEKLIVFLLPLLVNTAGYLTGAVALLTKWIVQGGKVSSALFRFFIDDLAGDLRAAVGKSRESNGYSLADPTKLVAEDFILIGRSLEELQVLLDVCLKCARKHGDRSCKTVLNGSPKNAP